MKFSYRYYHHPTPKACRKCGDSLLATSIFLTSSSLIMEWRWLGLTALLIGGLGKFLSDFFMDNDTAEQIAQQVK